jgi:hypothetical protein
MLIGKLIVSWRESDYMVTYCQNWDIPTSTSAKKQHKTANEKRLHSNEYADQNGLKGFSAISNNSSLAVPNGPFYKGLVSIDKSGESWHRETGTPLISWASMARGFFAGHYTSEMCRDLGKMEDGFQKRMIEVYGTADNFMRLRRARAFGEKKVDILRLKSPWPGC